MKFDDSAFGVKILETITDGLYDGNLNCLREYVQNSIDSHAKKIEIFHENGRKDLIIKDYGDGMDKNELENALKIGVSYKTNKDIGWRGIGIWSGSPVSEHIVIITKKKSGKKLRIEIDTEKLRKNKETDRKAVEVLTEVTGDIEELPINENEKDEQFTMIRLESILPTQQAIFKDDKIKEYLENNVPAPFNTNFKIAKKINGWLKEKNIIIPEVKIFFEEEEICRPPDRDDIFFEEPIFKEFKVKNKSIAFGWFLCSKNNRKLSSPNNGIYFKKKGFTIGDKDLIIKQFDGTYSQWQYGEIHVSSEKIRENAPRNNFEYNNDIVGDFLKDIGVFISQLQMMNRYQNSKVISRDIEKTKDDLSDGDTTSANRRIKKVKERLSRTQSYPKDDSLLPMKQVIDKQSQQDKQELTKVISQTKTTKPTTSLEAIKERFNILIGCSPDPIKKYLEQLSAKGKLEPEINAMQVIVNILKQKTSSKLNEINGLSKIAFGWQDVTPSKERSILTLTEGNKNIKNRDKYFGVMIYALQDLFINAAKHEKGIPSFNWFENCSEEERYAIAGEMYATISLIYRLIEKSTICQPNQGS